MKKIKEKNAKLKESPQEILNGFNTTIYAIEALKDNKNEEAQLNLKKATKFFEKGLKDNPNLKNVPVAVMVKINHIENTVQDIKNLINESEELLEDYQTQAARDILLTLQDEMIITTTYIPMELYPVSTKAAYDQLKKGDKEAAINALTEGMNAIITEQTIIPIPLLEAQAYIDTASDFENSDKKAARDALDLALNALEKAKTLGYIKKYDNEYKSFRNQITQIKQSVKDKNFIGKMYDNLKKDVNTLLMKIEGDVPFVGA